MPPYHMVRYAGKEGKPSGTDREKKVAADRGGSGPPRSPLGCGGVMGPRVTSVDYHRELVAQGLEV